MTSTTIGHGHARFLALTALLVAGAGCDGGAVNPRDDARERLVRDACLTVESAASAFRADAGRWPAGLADTTAAGKSLVDLLPGGLPIENAWTGEPTEPRPPEPDPPPGAVVYAPIGFGGAGYRVTGYGADAVLLVLDNVADLEETTIANCFAVQTTAETWAALSGGFYPSDVGVDVTPGGDTMIDLLDGGRLLVNPFTCAATEPVDGAAATPGATGYLAIRVLAEPRGYTITGAGETGRIIVTIMKSGTGDSTVVIDR